MSNNTLANAETLGRQLGLRGWKLAVAESCTGGGIAHAVTDISGSSAWFDRGFVTYSNQSKIDMLGVKVQTLESFGAVSKQTALEMAEGTLMHSEADMALAVTGIAGPSGGSADKPVGTVFVAWIVKNFTAECTHLRLSGNRQEIRQQAIDYCLEKALALSRHPQ